MGTAAARKMETVLSPAFTKFAKKPGSSASRGEDAPKPDKVTACLATRLHNFPGQNSFLPKCHFFIVPPGEVASPFLSVRGARGSHALLACSPKVRRECTQTCRAQCLQERHVVIVTDDVASTAASGVPVCRGAVFPECATARKQAAFKCLRHHFGRQPCITRYDWLTKLRTAGSGRSWHPLLAPRSQTFFEADQAFN
jgi:hypothetical protein